MSINIDEKGNIYIYKGDSGNIVLYGIPTNSNYRVYLTIKDLKNNTVGNPLEVTSNFSSTVTFSISSEFSDLLKVPKNESMGVYTYGIKTVDEEGHENTLFVKGCSYGEINKVFVFPEKVEV